MAETHTYSADELADARVAAYRVVAFALTWTLRLRSGSYRYIRARFRP